MQLFSSPQHVAAPSTSNDPVENDKLLPPSNDNIRLDKITSKSAMHILFEIFSLNIINANIDVATISKLFRSDAFEAVVLDIQFIRRIGYDISSKIMPMVYGRSDLHNLADPGSFLPLSRNNIPIPIPAPRYSIDAVIVGPTLFSMIFETGVLIA